MAWSLALALLATIAVIAAVIVVTLSMTKTESFTDLGPLAPPTFKPCEVYYTPDQASCDDGTFLTSRAAHVATLADLDAQAQTAPLSAEDTVNAAALRMIIAEMDKLPGPGAACKVTLPAPWTRVVSDPDDTIFATPDGPGTMFCYLPTMSASTDGATDGATDEATDYDALAAPGARVSTTAQTFDFHAPTSVGPGDPATSQYRRFQFDNVALDGFARGFACQLPEVKAARAKDARYDVSRANWSTLMTFGVRAFGRKSMALISAQADGDLLQVMRGFYEESCPPDASATTATLWWTPHLEAGAQVLRVQKDACDQPFADTTFDDKCVVGRPVALKTYSMVPKPAAFGTTPDILATKADAQEQLKKFTAALESATAFLTLQQARYDNVLEILRRTLEAWEISVSEGLQDTVDGAAALESRPVFAEATSKPSKYVVVATPPTAPPTKIEADDSLLDGGPRPPNQRVGPGLPGPTFYVTPGSASNRTDFGPTPTLATRAVTSPPGFHVTAVHVAVVGVGRSRIKAIITCKNPATGETRMLDSDPNDDGPVFSPPPPPVPPCGTNPNVELHDSLCYDMTGGYHYQSPGVLKRGCPGGQRDNGTSCWVDVDTYSKSCHTGWDGCAWRSSRQCTSWGALGETCTGGDCVGGVTTSCDGCRDGYRDTGLFCTRDAHAEPNWKSQVGTVPSYYNT